MEEKQEWTLSVFYKKRYHNIKAELIYKSAQIQRIKVHGSKGYIVLQNNYPMAKLSKKGIQWKLIEGTPLEATLLADIMQRLEMIIKAR